VTGTVCYRRSISSEGHRQLTQMVRCDWAAANCKNHESLDHGGRFRAHSIRNRNRETFPLTF
jgi:hypothetical protein